MATLLKFKLPSARKPAQFKPGHTAEIILFTGVRYEHWDTAQAEKPKAEAAKRKRRTKAKRPAQSIAL